MYFGSNDEIDSYTTLDIDSDADIVRLNKHEMDNKSRKNIAAYLRDKISEQDHRSNNDIYTNQDEILQIEMIGEDIDFNSIDSLYIEDLEFKRKRFKNSYNDVRIFTTIENGECSYHLKEGNRYLSLEESWQVVDLIEKSGNVTFSVDKDAWIKIQKS